MTMRRISVSRAAASNQPTDAKITTHSHMVHGGTGVPERRRKLTLTNEAAPSTAKNERRTKAHDSKSIDEEPRRPRITGMQWIHVAPGLSVPLLGSGETIRAINQRRISRQDCWTCEADLGYTKAAHFVLCPHCRCIIPTGKSRGQASVGLGFTYNPSLHGELVEFGQGHQRTVHPKEGIQTI